MSKKTFQFNAIDKKFEVTCNMSETEHDSNCPIVRVYRAGIDTKVSTPANDVNKIYVQLADAATVETVNTMFGIGETMCAHCRFNANVGKKR